MLARIVRGGDVVGRVGGEEFGIFLNFSDVVYASSVAERIRREIGSTPVYLREGRVKIDLTVSLGVADSKKFSDLESFYAKVDSLLYESKKGGRNRTTCLL